MTFFSKIHRNHKSTRAPPKIIITTLKTVFTGVVEALSVPSAAAIISLATSVPFTFGSCFALGSLGVDFDTPLLAGDLVDLEAPLLAGDLVDLRAPLLFDGAFEGNLEGDMVELGKGAEFTSSGPDGDDGAPLLVGAFVGAFVDS